MDRLVQMRARVGTKEDAATLRDFREEKSQETIISSMLPIDVGMYT